MRTLAKALAPLVLEEVRALLANRSTLALIPDMTTTRHIGTSRAWDAMSSTVQSSSSPPWQSRLTASTRSRSSSVWEP